MSVTSPIDLNRAWLVAKSTADGLTAILHLISHNVVPGSLQVVVVITDAGLQSTFAYNAGAFTEIVLS